MSTALDANTLTDGTASFSVPNPVTGRVGLIGLELNPNTTQGQTFTIIGNTATQIFTDPADGAMTDVAISGDGYIGRPRPGQPGHRRARQGEHVGSADRGEWKHPQAQTPWPSPASWLPKAWC